MTSVVRAPTREFRTMTQDWRRWEGFSARPDDIVVATFPKCGTTWTQRIVDLLLFQSPEARPFMVDFPWLDSVLFSPIEDNLATLEAQTHRRCVKSHMPLDALPIYDGVKYIHVARDGRDACLSMHNHMLGMTGEHFARAAALAEDDPRIRRRPGVTPEDPRTWCVNWLAQAEAEETEGYGLDLPFFEFETTYWRGRAQPWLLLVHYNDLKADLAGEMARISEFLEIDTPKALMPELVQAASFEAMKAKGDELAPNLRRTFDRGPERFFHKGCNGRWKDVLTEGDLARYDALVKRKFTPALANWVENGRLKAGDPRKVPD
jgi:aryl sulfotransferase